MTMESTLVGSISRALFAASRAQLVREVIRPALERGAVVLCDRFLDSTTVYQGVARALDRRDVAAVNAFAVGGTLPGLTLLLDLDAAEGRRRAASRKGPVDRMEQEGEEFYEAVRRGYLELAGASPDRFAVIDASGNEASVENLITAALAERNSRSCSEPKLPRLRRSGSATSPSKSSSPGDEHAGDACRPSERRPRRAVVAGGTTRTLAAALLRGL
jgi:dTMP kinase